jgi:biotin carboxylase
MKKKLLVLGASKYQIPTILKARSLGFTVITADNIPDNPGHNIADISYNIDTTDTSSIISIATKEKIIGIISPATDVAVISAAAAAEALNLPGPPLSAAKLMTNKSDFRSFLRRHNWPCPQSWPFSEPIFPSQCPLTSGPWIIKPNRSSGSKGVFRVSSESNFLDYAYESLHVSLDKTALIEQYVFGSQHTVEGILENGLIKVFLITDRQTAPPPYVATWGHKVPSLLTKTDQITVINFISLVLKSLDIQNGPFDCDLVFTDDKRVFLLEISPRIGGNSLSRLFDAAFETDYLQYSVCYATGQPNLKIEALSDPKPVALALLGVMDYGQIHWNPLAMKAFNDDPAILFFQIDIPFGSYVEPFINGRYRLGEILWTAVNRVKLDELYKNFIELLDLKVIY